MKAQKKLPPVIMIIFGGSGDLTSRKLMPALFNLFIDKYLPDDFIVAGIGRTDYGGDEKYRGHLFDGVKKFSRRKDNVDEAWKKFAEKIFYLQADAGDDAAYRQIEKFITEKSKELKDPVIIYYMAVAPQIAPVIA